MFDFLKNSKKEANKDKCKHVFIQTHLTKPVPTYCEECEQLCFIFQNLRKCSFCDSYLHHDCWKKRFSITQTPPKQSPSTSPALGATSTPSDSSNNKARSFDLDSSNEHHHQTPLIHFSAGDGQVMQQTTHIHSLILSKSATLGSTCDVCKKHIFTFFGSNEKTSEQYFFCADCDWRAHRECYEKTFIEAVTAQASMSDTTSPIAFPVLTEEDYLKRMEVQQKLIAESKANVVSGTLEIVKALDKRNRQWGEYVVNPAALYRVQKSQAEVYVELVNELGGISPASQNFDRNRVVSRDLLDQLHDILRFATAMYGRAYEEGYFASVMKSLFMQTFRKDLVNAKPEHNNEAVANILSLPRSKILLSYWGVEISEPTFAVIDDTEAHDRVVLAFRGSLTESDFGTDACGTLVEFEGVPGAKVHIGIAASVNKLFDKNHKLFIIDKLVEIMKTKPMGTKLLVCGHSLGGGLVETFCIRALTQDCLAYQHPEAPIGNIRKTKQFLFGYAYAPPPLVTKPVVDQFDNNIISIVAAKDCVPRLQLPSVDRLGAHFLATKKIQQKEETEEQDGLKIKIEEPKSLTLAEHLAEDEDLAKQLELQEECHLAGRIVFTTHPTNRATKAFFIPRESPLLHTIFVSSHMIANHTMDNYAEALQLANLVDEDKIHKQLEAEFGVKIKPKSPQ